MTTRLYALAKKARDGFDRETEVYFMGWQWSEDLQSFEPHWGHPHADGVRTTTMYASTKVIQTVLNKLPAEFKVGAYVVDLKIEPV